MQERRRDETWKEMCEVRQTQVKRKKNTKKMKRKTKRKRTKWRKQKTKRM